MVPVVRGGGWPEDLGLLQQTYPGGGIYKGIFEALRPARPAVERSRRQEGGREKGIGTVAERIPDQDRLSGGATAEVRAAYCLSEGACM